MSRRKLITAAVAAVVLVLLGTGYWYWAWDPTPVERYLPGDVPLVLHAKDLSAGLDTIEYVDMVSTLPGLVRDTALLPYSPLGQVLGFVRLPLVPVLVLLGITVLYVLGSELAKRAFYARVQG